MTAFLDITVGKTPAESVDIQQVIDALSGRRNTPLSTVINDPLAYAYTLKNTNPVGRAVIIYAPDGTTVLFSVDATGVKVSPGGAAAVAPLTDVGPGGAQVAIGNHVHGAGGYAGTGAVTLEGLYAASVAITGVNMTVAAGILFVFCTSGVTVHLPNAATTARPITVTAIAGITNVDSPNGGAVIGGSTNTSTGAVMNGVVNPGDAITWKSDGTDWRAV